ncbi:hypothetical protein [Acidovorax sp. SRB_24]|uniref:hypothetical protein n=1 Tax=Acidovorax sp. SRB_24 TaxID=1962700 RepID=UPI00145E73AF|nr:hypothetical protein [Acidovorax sp. SRB_24]
MGLLISTSAPEGWMVNLHPMDGDTSVFLRQLSDAHMVKRRSDGCMVIAGMEWDEGYLRRWPQTWLCGPTQTEAIAATNALSAWLEARYTGAC